MFAWDGNIWEPCFRSCCSIINKLSSCSVPMSQTYSHSTDMLSTYPGPVAQRLHTFHPLTALQSIILTYKIKKNDNSLNLSNCAESDHCWHSIQSQLSLQKASLQMLFHEQITRAFKQDGRAPSRMMFSLKQKNIFTDHLKEYMFLVYIDF